MEDVGGNEILKVLKDCTKRRKQDMTIEEETCSKINNLGVEDVGGNNILKPFKELYKKNGTGYDNR